MQGMSTERGRILENSNPEKDLVSTEKQLNQA